MIVIYKKRILLIFLAVIISLFSYKIVFNSQDTIPTVSLPVSNKVVVLDAGHGKPDEGAESANGVTEQSINLTITKKVQSLLEQSRVYCSFNKVGRKWNI